MCLALWNSPEEIKLTVVLEEMAMTATDFEALSPCWALFKALFFVLTHLSISLLFTKISCLYVGKLRHRDVKNSRDNVSRREGHLALGLWF